MTDILIRITDYVFSYRVAGILIRDGKVLLQKLSNDTRDAFSSGHVVFSQTKMLCGQMQTYEMD